MILLPQPRYNPEEILSLEAALYERRSIRRFSEEKISIEDISQLLWSAQGKNRHKRTTPSAGARYPVELYVAMPIGVYKYIQKDHSMVLISEEDKRLKIKTDAPLLIIFCLVYARTTTKYGKRGIRYAHIEIGHAAQNVCLQAVSLGLGSYCIGAFRDGRLKRTLGCDEDPVYITAIGRPK